MKNYALKSLNPCFAGLLVSDNLQLVLWSLTNSGVLILVLLDYWFLTPDMLAGPKHNSCLNPCFAGLLVSDAVRSSNKEMTNFRLNPCFAGLLVSDYAVLDVCYDLLTS